jgi:predicted Zn-dependent peptidase
MSRMAKSLLDFERLVPLEEVLQSVQDVTPSDVRTAATELLCEESLSMAVIGPAAEMEGVMAA